jgi:hypothetical protein
MPQIPYYNLTIHVPLLSPLKSTKLTRKSARTIWIADLPNKKFNRDFTD